MAAPAQASHSHCAAFHVLGPPPPPHFLTTKGGWKAKGEKRRDTKVNEEKCMFGLEEQAVWFGWFRGCSYVHRYTPASTHITADIIQ